MPRRHVTARGAAEGVSRRRRIARMRIGRGGDGPPGIRAPPWIGGQLPTPASLHLGGAERRHPVPCGGQLQEQHPQRRDRHGISPVEMNAPQGLVREEHVGGKPGAPVPAPDEPGDVGRDQAVRDVVPGPIRREVGEAEAGEAESLEERRQGEPRRERDDDARASGALPVVVPGDRHHRGVTRAPPRPVARPCPASARVSMPPP